MNSGDPGVREAPLPRELLRAFSPVHKSAFGIAIATVCALLVFGATAVTILQPPGSRIRLELLAVYFRGYSVSWVGALMTGFLWRLALAGFSQYVRDMSRFSVHGSIGGVVAFLLWIYVSAVILLYGAEVTAAYARLRRHRPDEIPAAPSPRL